MLDHARHAFARYALLKVSDDQFQDWLWWSSNVMKRMSGAGGWEQTQLQPAYNGLFEQAKQFKDAFLNFDFVVGNTFQLQLLNMKQYSKDVLHGLGLRNTTVIVLQLCFWEPNASYFSQENIDLWKELAQVARQVVLLTCMLRPAPGHAVLNLYTRNQFLHQFVTEDKTGVFRVLDITCLTDHLPHELILSLDNVHYQSYLWSTKDFLQGPVVCPQTETGSLARYFDLVLANGSGHCDDPVNSHLLQQLFSLIL